MSNFLKDIIKETGNEYATLVSEGVDSADVTSFDASEALAMPGVLGILRASDVPVAEEPSYPMLTDKPRQLGMPIAAIAAETEAIAAEALE